MPRATTTERSRPMKRTSNGILIPDVPIMAGGNLPNAVKGNSADGGVKWNKMGGYLESTSRLQQIDLLLPVREFVAELDFSTIANITNAIFFGYNFENKCSYLRQSVDTSQEIQGVVNYTHILTPDLSLTLNNRAKLTFKVADGASETRLNGILVGTSAENVQSLPTLYVFNGWSRNSSHYDLGGMIRLWSLKITTLDGEVLRDMWPAYTSENTPALYDYISKLYYVNTGEGELICSYL